MSNQPVDGLEILKGMLDAIYVEAGKNPNFCESLLRALPKSAVIEIKRQPSRTKRPPFDQDSINPLAILLKDGDIKLRTLLAKLTKAEISAIIKRHNLVLPQNARKAKATKQVLIDGIVQFAEFSAREHAA